MKKILVVEDSVLVQRIIQDALEINFPCIIMGVEDGARAYEELKVNTYDLVVTDIVMPIMDGLTLAEKIRVDLASDVPIIMLTSLGVKNVRDSSSATGVNAYLTKPIDIEHLIKVVSRFIPKESTLEKGEAVPEPVPEPVPPIQNGEPLMEPDETSLPEIEEWTEKIDEDW